MLGQIIGISGGSVILVDGLVLNPLARGKLKFHNRPVLALHSEIVAHPVRARPELVAAHGNHIDVSAVVIEGEVAFVHMVPLERVAADMPVQPLFGGYAPGAIEFDENICICSGEILIGSFDFDMIRCCHLDTDLLYSFHPMPRQRPVCISILFSNAGKNAFDLGHLARRRERRQPQNLMKRRIARIP